MEIFNLRRAESLIEGLRKEAELKAAMENSICSIHANDASPAAAEELVN